MSKATDQHIALATENLDEMASYTPGHPAYHGLAQAAIARLLAALAIMMDGQERPPVPGLPRGWDLDTVQDPDGSRKWRYTLTSPGGREYTARHLWDTSEAALAAGIRSARSTATATEQERK